MSLLSPKRILVCVDGSEAGFRAADFAMTFASGIRSKLIFLNIVGASASEHDYEITADMVGSFETLGMESLSRCEDKAKRTGLQYEIVQASGDPVEEILKQSEATESDCIVMGRMPLSRVEKLIVDSVSEEVLKRSKLPVIIVK